MLDLKPTSEETIQQLELSPHDLWMVRIKSEVFGPFEAESLKHYAGENQALFEGAEAVRQDQSDWQPFFTLPQFQRRGPQVIRGQKEPGPYWLLHHGQKTGPLSKQELDKKIELGSVGLTDLISIDDGHGWCKLYQVEGFDRRFHSSSELPFAPSETNFQKARVELLEKIESEATRPHEELAQMAHSAQLMGKVLSFKAEDVPLKAPAEIPMGHHLKWQVPLAVALMLTVLGGTYHFATSPSTEAEIAMDEAVTPEVILPRPEDQTPNPSAQIPPVRRPASLESNNFVPPEDSPSYTTHMETHQNDMPEPQDNYQDQPMELEGREPAAVEHSLVGQPEDLQGQSLDSAMGNPPPPPEEISDF